MKVLLINGSPHKEGSTYTALNEVAKSLNDNNIESEIVHIGTKAIRGCIACGVCKETGKCAFNDELYNELYQKVKEVDGIVVGSPVYYAGPNGSLCSILDRLFYSASASMRNKVSAAVVSCRRGGASATFDRLNKYFTINQMPVVSSQYWNSIHGNNAEEAKQDLEGLQTMRVLGNNMSWMLKSMGNSKEEIPKQENRIATNFIR